MGKSEIIQGIYDGILGLDKDKAVEMAIAVLSEDLNINEIIDQGMSPAMDEVGSRFQAGEMYLPELVKSAEVFSAAMEVLQPRLLEGKTEIKAKGRVVVGTVKGDLHSIGKDLVATMLKIAGFEVTDLGVDIQTFTFLEEAQKFNADVIALSALLTTTMPAQREIMEALKSEGMDGKYKVIIGGAPVNQGWADEIGADAYGENAAEAVKQAERLCG